MNVPPDDATTDLHAAIAALRAERDAALSEKAALAEALATRNSEYGAGIKQQSATIEVLKVMSATPGDPQPVFDLIVRRARDLCNAAAAILFEFDGRFVHFRARSGYEMDQTVQAEYQSRWPAAPTRDSITCRAILDKEIIHVRDLDTESDLLPVVRRMGHKSQLSIPLLREGNALGDITLAALDPGGFSDSQIELLKTFAEQAVIAIASAETYRALQARTADLQESLEYQTATSDVLKVISRSTFDLQPVLAMVAETAVRLCQADQAAIFRREGDLWRLAANFGFPPE
jgi:two-component system, NtrC family, sensor kinase